LTISECLATLVPALINELLLGVMPVLLLVRRLEVKVADASLELSVLVIAGESEVDGAVTQSHGKQEVLVLNISLQWSDLVEELLVIAEASEESSGSEPSSHAVDGVLSGSWGRYQDAGDFGELASVLGQQVERAEVAEELLTCAGSLGVLAGNAGTLTAALGVLGGRWGLCKPLGFDLDDCLGGSVRSHVGHEQAIVIVSEVDALTLGGSDIV